MAHSDGMAEVRFVGQFTTGNFISTGRNQQGVEHLFQNDSCPLVSGASIVKGTVVRSASVHQRRRCSLARRFRQPCCWCG